MYLLSLLGCSGLSGTDGPYRLIGNDDLLHIFCCKVIEDILDLRCAYLEMLAGFPFRKILSDAENDAKSACKGKLDFLYKLLISFTIILTALRVSEDGPLAADSLEHVY